MRRVSGRGKAVLLKRVINAGELAQMEDAEARHHFVLSGAVFAAECHWCHPGATEQQKLGMEVVWELPAVPQPVPPWGKQQGWLGMWMNDASTLGLDTSASKFPCLWICPEHESML